MEAIAGNQLAVKVQFEIGHTSRLRSKKTSEGFTHDWEIYVQGVNKADISTYVEKVVFVLHESFPRPKRVIKEPPYVLQESGYAGFMLPIEIHFRNKEEPRFQFSYDLDLQQVGPPHHRSEIKNFLFQHPSEEFKKKLFQGGGVIVSAIVNSNSLQGPPPPIASNMNLAEGTSNSLNAAVSPSGIGGGMVSKPKMSSSDSKKHKSSPNAFSNLFGAPQMKNKPSPDTKSMSGSGGGSVKSSSGNSVAQMPNASNPVAKSTKDKDKSGGGTVSDKARIDKKADRQKLSPHKEARSGESKKSHESKQRSDEGRKEKRDKVRDKDRAREKERGEKRALSPKAVRESLGISPKRFSPQPRPSSSASEKKPTEGSARSNSKDKTKSSSSSSSGNKKSKKDKKDRDREKRDEKHQNPIGDNAAVLSSDAKNSTNNSNSASASSKKVDLKDTNKGGELTKNKDPKSLEKSVSGSNPAITSIGNNERSSDGKKEKRVHKHKKKSKTKDKEKEKEKEKDKDKESERSKDKVKDKESKSKDVKETMDPAKLSNNKSPATTKATTAAASAAATPTTAAANITSTTATTITTLSSSTTTSTIATATATAAPIRPAMNATKTSSDGHKKLSSSKEKKNKDKKSDDQTKSTNNSSNNKKKDKDATLKNSTPFNNNNLDFSDTGDSVLSTADLNLGLGKKVPAIGNHNQLTDESSNSSFPDLPPKILTSNKISKNSPSQRDAAKPTPTKHKKSDKSDEGNKKRRRPNTNNAQATNNATNATVPTSDAISPDHAFVEPPTKQMKRETGKSPAVNSPANTIANNGNSTTPTRPNNVNEMASGGGVGTAPTNMMPQSATSPINHDANNVQYVAMNNEPKDYMSELQELHNKIMTLQDNEELQHIVELIATTGCYEITSKTFDFDLCKLDRNTVKLLQDHFAGSTES